MVFPLGTPFFRQDKESYRRAMLARAGGSFADATKVQDGFLELVANRAGAVATCYGLFLAISAILIDQAKGTPVEGAVIAGTVGVFVALVSLVPVFWINWADDPTIYESAEREFDRTIGLFYARSLYFNFSIFVAVLSFSASLAAFMLYRLSVPAAGITG